MTGQTGQEALADQKFEGVWLVEHPLNYPEAKDIKKKARKAGMKIIDVRYANAVSKDLVKQVIKRKPATPAQ